MTGFKCTFIGLDSLIHIVAMPGKGAFTACGKWNVDETDIRPLRPVTCLRCWAREFLEWEMERAHAHGRRRFS